MWLPSMRCGYCIVAKQTAKVTYFITVKAGMPHDPEHEAVVRREIKNTHFESIMGLRLKTLGCVKLSYR